MTLLVWQCRLCGSITYTKQEDLSGHSLNLPCYCQGCGEWIDRENIEYLGMIEGNMPGTIIPPTNIYAPKKAKAVQQALR